MPTVLARSPQGVTVLQDDGSVVTLPPDMGPDAGTPTQDDLQSGAPPVPPPAPPSESPVPPGPYPGPPVDTGPPAVQAPNAAGGAVLAAPHPDQGDLSPSIPSAPPGGASGTAPPSAPPAAAPAVDPNAPPTVQRAQAEAAKGAAAFDASLVQANIKRQADAAVAPLETQQQELRAKNAAGLSKSIDEANAAVKAMANYDVGAPKDTTGQSIGKLIALALGGIGQALSRQAGPNPVIAILEQKAAAEARDRMAKYGQLGQLATQKREATDEIRKTITGQEAQYHAHVAAVLAKYDREGERHAILSGGTAALWAGTATHAELMQKQAEETQKAGEVQWKEKKEHAELKVQQENAKTSRLNAYTEAGKAAEDKRQHGVANAWKAADFSLELQKQLSGTPAERAAAEKDIAERSMPQIPVDVKQADGSVVRGFKTLINADKKVALYPSAEIGKDLGKAWSETEQYITDARELYKHRDDVGGEWFKTTGARQMLARHGDMEAKLKERYGLRTASEANKELFGKVIGTDNPTEFTAWKGAVLDAIKEGKDIAEETLNAKLRKEGKYTGDEIHFPDLSADAGPTAPLSQVGQATKQAIATSRGPGPEVKPTQTSWALSGGFGGDMMGDEGRAKPPPPPDPALNAQVDAVAKAAKAGDTEALASMQKLLRDWGTTNVARAAAAKYGLDIPRQR